MPHHDSGGEPTDTGPERFPFSAYRQLPAPGATAGADPASGPRPPPGRPRRSVVAVIVGAFAGGVLGAVLTLVVLDARGALDRPPVTVTVPVTSPATTAATSPPEPTGPAGFAGVAAEVIPSIVSIWVDGPEGEASGSGVVYSAGGVIITNNHVVAAGSTFQVELSDGTRLPARPEGTDPLTDLAVLSVGRPGLRPIVLGRASDLRIGEPAVAVGNPLGLQGGPSVTAGVISALGRTLQVSGEETLYGLVQTDAPITRGSSGGALVDQNGALIGITTAIGVSDVGAEGLGFAIPVDLVVGVVEDLIRDGKVDHALLGISGTTATDTDTDGASIPSGVEISALADPSAIQEAGGRVGDVIVAINGAKVTTIDDLIAKLRRHRAGDHVTVTLRRDGGLDILDVTLGRYPQ